MGAGHRLEDHLPWPTDVPAAMTVYGPNGFIRKLRGKGATALLVREQYLPDGGLRLHLRNGGATVLEVRVVDKSYGIEARALSLRPQEHKTVDYALGSSDDWYDLEVQDKTHSWRLAGHVENGQMSKTDPANAAPVLAI
ncbi:phospholipase domain-containing protein [Acidithiobacillus sp. IBUN Pt1247-S3]|uniref:phospholipase domain-containing protein n=1 Tax=Acidithiobacillus sp. IBUN Pt1247-S3 TaxID=3166642 RepID=UPI0034E3774D